MIRKLIGAALMLATSSALAWHVPAPSFNDFPELYTQRPAQAQGQPQSRTAPAPRAGSFKGGGHPDSMHDSY